MEQLEDALGKKIIDAQTLEIIQERVKYHTENPPNMICVNVVLNGVAALKHIICKEIIMNAANVSEQEADWYILRAGSERELSRLATIGVVMNSGDEL
jgi:hypothetical protein